MNRILAILVILSSASAFAMPATDGRDATYVARESDYDQVVLVITGSVDTDKKTDGVIEVPVTVLNSMIDETYKPKTVQWELPRPYYGGGNDFKPNKVYILALRNNGRVVWELTRQVEIKEITSPEIKLPLSKEELDAIRKKRR